MTQLSETRLKAVAARLTPWLLLLVGISFVAMTVLGSLNNAIVSDEQHHVGRLKAFLNHGIYVAGYTGNGNIPSFGNMFAYAPMFSLVAHGIAVLFGVETWSTVSETATGYGVRHITIAIFGAVAAAVVGYTIYRITRSRNWGLFGSIVLLALPMWTGSAMYNVKDVPVGAGYALLTAGFVSLAVSPKQDSKRNAIAAWLLIFSGTLFTIGVRQGMWPGLVLHTVTLLLLLLVLNRDETNNFWKSIQKTLFAVSAMAVGYLSLMAIYPKAFLNPYQFLKMSFKTSSDFPHKTLLLTNGVYEKTPVGAGYLPQWIAAKTPDLVLLLVVAGLVATVVIIIRRLFTKQFTRFDAELPAASLALVQFLAFPLAAIILHSNVYGGMRQFLFIVPAMAIIFTLTLYVLLRELKNKKRITLYWITAGVTAIGLVLPTVAQAQLFPYNSEYFNQVTTAGGIDNRWDVDRWHLSAREVLEKMPIEQRDRCVQITHKIRYCQEANNVAAYAPFPTKGMNEAQPLAVNEFVTSRYPDIPDECRTLDAVTRNILWTSVLIGASSACPLHPAEYAPKPTGESAMLWWESHFAWGWRAATETGIDSVPGKESQLSFILPEKLRGLPLEIDFEAEFSDTAAKILSVTVNGEQMKEFDLTHSSLSGSFRVASQIANTLSDHSINVSFRLLDENGEKVTTVLHLSDLKISG